MLCKTRKIQFPEIAKRWKDGKCSRNEAILLLEILQVLKVKSKLFPKAPRKDG